MGKCGLIDKVIRDQRQLSTRENYKYIFDSFTFEALNSRALVISTHAHELQQIRRFSTTSRIGGLMKPLGKAALLCEKPPSAIP
jgi:hypothetical protein